MTTRTAVKDGNWSDATVWDSNPVLPGAGDVADCAGYDVTIDQDVTCTQIQTSSSGSFLVTAARTITANIVSATGALDYVLKCSHATGTVTINGNVLAGEYRALNTTGNGAVTITGNVTGGTASNAFGIFFDSGTPTYNIGGNVTGGSGSGANGAYLNAQFTSVNIAGNVYGGSGYNAYGVHGGYAGTLAIGGSVYGSAYAGIYVQATMTLTVAGSVYGGSTGYGIQTQGGSPTVTISGNVTGGSGTSGHGIMNNVARTVTVLGTVIGGSVFNNAFGYYGNDAGALLVCNAIQFGANGETPTFGKVKIAPNSATNLATVIRSDTGAVLTMSWDYPAVGDVEVPVNYALVTLQGTFVVPAPSDVRAGVGYGAGGTEFVGTATFLAAMMLAGGRRLRR
jgi:hypothetical protein